MGYGGHVLWTAVFSNLYEHSRAPIQVAGVPLPSDLLRGVLYDRSRSFAQDPIFRNNPKLLFTAPSRKGWAAQGLDAAFRLTVLRVRWLKRAYERCILALSERHSRRAGYRLIHPELSLHSYARRETRRRLVWKSGGHIVDLLSRSFGAPPRTHQGELYFDEEERAQVRRLLESRGLRGFVAVEPETNQEWFGTLRAWPWERWQALVDALRAALPDVPIVQIGVDGSRRLSGVVDLCGQTAFRDAVLVLREARLFLGTEGGLMHAAHAVGARSLILWGGVTLPEFAGYPHRQRVLCAYVPCAPCGNRGWCDYGHRCMNEIQVPEVLRAALELLASGEDPGRAPSVRVPLEAA